MPGLNQEAPQGEKGPEYNPAFDQTERKKNKGFFMRFPDGTTQMVGSQAEAIEAMQNWRDN